MLCLCAVSLRLCVLGSRLSPHSDKSKRRTKTVKKTVEPKWSQKFVYTHVHRRDFRNHMLELTVWDQPRMPDEDSTFMGEVRGGDRGAYGDTAHKGAHAVTALETYI